MQKDLTYRLQNYLRTSRKRLGLSQNDIAFLLGTNTPSKLSRYEHYARHPRLKTALKLGVVTGEPLKELFAGLSQDAEMEVCERARKLRGKYMKSRASSRIQQKLQALETIISQ